MLFRSYFDSENNDALLNAIPTYLREDSANDQYFLFTQMIGQNFDNVWVYLKDITNKFDADNRLNYGISKDIVAQAIRDLGVKIYQNNFSSNDLYSALLGITPSGSLFNVPDITSVLPTPSGLEYVNTYISASAPESLEPVDDINKETYKKIYHNLPLLLKKKGTPEGLRLLVNTYGIPDTILRINEFGGKSTSLQAWDNFVDQFNYAFYSEGTGYVSTSWRTSAAGLGNEYPASVLFRFKTNGIPAFTPYSQWLVNTPNFYITLDYNGTRYASGSYNGSIPDPYNHYGTLTFIDKVSSNACNIYLPFFDGGWWSVMLNGRYYQNVSLTPNLFELFAANNLYDGYDGSEIGFYSSSSVSIPGTILGSHGIFYLSNPSVVSSIYPFSGSFQELRFYNKKLNFSVFEDYVMNPYSIEGNSPEGTNSSLNSLFFRAPLGSMLDNNGSGTQTRVSIHPAISTYPVTQSFILGNSNYTLNGTYTFEPNTEVIYQDQFDAGVKNSVSEKIRIVNTTLPPGNTLSQYISIQQHSYTGENFTKDVNYVEAAFSPQIGRAHV